MFVGFFHPSHPAPNRIQSIYRVAKLSPASRLRGWRSAARRRPSRQQLPKSDPIYSQAVSGADSFLTHRKMKAGVAPVPRHVRKVACLFNSSLQSLRCPKSGKSPKYLNSFVPVNENDRDAHHLLKLAGTGQSCRAQQKTTRAKRSHRVFESRPVLHLQKAHVSIPFQLPLLEPRHKAKAQLNEAKNLLIAENDALLGLNCLDS